MSIRFPILVSPNGSAEMFSSERGQIAEFTNLHFCSAVAVLSAVKGRLGAKSWPWLILQRNVISKDCLSPAEFKTPLATVKIQNTDATYVFSQREDHPQSAPRSPARDGWRYCLRQEDADGGLRMPPDER